MLRVLTPTRTRQSKATQARLFAARFCDFALAASLEVEV